MIDEICGWGGGRNEEKVRIQHNLSAISDEMNGGTISGNQKFRKNVLNLRCLWQFTGLSLAAS